MLLCLSLKRVVWLELSQLKSFKYKIRFFLFIIYLFIFIYLFAYLFIYIFTYLFIFSYYSL